MEEEEKNKKTQREQAGEDEGRMGVLERVWRKRKKGVGIEITCVVEEIA